MSTFLLLDIWLRLFTTHKIHNIDSTRTRTRGSEQASALAAVFRLVLVPDASLFKIAQHCFWTKKTAGDKNGVLLLLPNDARAPLNPLWRPLGGARPTL